MSTVAHASLHQPQMIFRHPFLSVRILFPAGMHKSLQTPGGTRVPNWWTVIAASSHGPVHLGTDNRAFYILFHALRRGARRGPESRLRYPAPAGRAIARNCLLRPRLLAVEFCACLRLLVLGCLLALTCACMRLFALAWVCLCLLARVVPKHRTSASM